MPIVLVKNVRCEVCDKPTPLLVSSLEERLGYRSNSSTYGIQVFFACPHCSTIAQSELPVLTERLEIAEGQQHPGDRVPIRVLLECAQTGCAARIEVLGTVKTGTSNSRARDACRNWKFGREVQCENMHRPMRTVEIAGLVM
jgi:hypothetical protein